MPRRPAKPRRSGRDTRKPRPDGPLELRNPHTAYEALRRRPSDAVCLRVTGEGGPAWARVVELVERNAIRIDRSDPSRDQHHGDQHDGVRGPGGRQTGMTLVIAPPPSAKLNQMLTDTRSDRPGLWLACEQVQDPRNLGAIFRSAAFFGVRGVLLTKDRSASLTSIACDTSAGGCEAIPHATVGNFARTLGVCRDEYGLRIVGASEHAEQPIDAIAGPQVDTLLVLGNEEKGLRRLTREHCDALAAVPALGQIGSLNVSVAAGVLMFALTRGEPSR